MQRTFAAVLAVLSLALAACGAGAAATAGKTGMAGMAGMDQHAPAGAPNLKNAVATDKVTIENFAFSPAVVTVPVGTTVTWTNNDEEPHTVVDGAQGIKSKVLGNQGSQYSFTFTAAGTYNYNCSIHPFMHGTVVVTA